MMLRGRAANASPRRLRAMSALRSRSMVSEKAAHHPITPAMMSHTARAFGRVWVTGCVMPRIMAPRTERMPRAGAVEIRIGASSAHSRGESAIMVDDASRPRRQCVTQKTSGDERPSQHEPRAGCRPSEFAAPQVRHRTRFRRTTRGVVRREYASDGR